jgi:uncharacterized protein YccT (UPF0319 family)
MLMLALTACVQNPVRKLYEGEQRPRSEIAVVRVPIELEVMRINGERIEGLNTLFSPQHKDLHLLPGEYRILAYYKDLWELSGDGHDVVKTDPALFVVNAKAGQTYELGFEEPKNLEEARRLENKFSGYVLNTETGTKTPTRASGLVFKSGIAGSLGEITGVEAVEQTNNSGGRASSSTLAPLKNEQPENGENNTSDSTGESRADPGQTQSDQNYLNMLKAYWSQATQQERRAFLEWISEKDKSPK